MNAITDTGASLVVNSGGWRRRLFALALIGASIAVTFLLVTSFYPGVTFVDRLTVAYAAVWEPTTQRPFTFIMRDNPWLLNLPSHSSYAVRRLSNASYILVEGGRNVSGFGHRSSSWARFLVKPIHY